MESPAKQKEATTTKSNEKLATLRVSLGDVSWRALDYKGFGHDEAFKEVGMGQPSP